MKRLLFLLSLILIFQLSFSQQLFNAAIVPYTKGQKKIILQDKNPETGNWRILSISYYDTKGMKVKQENYRYDSEFENGFCVVPTLFLYSNNKLIREDHIEYKSEIRNDLYHFDTLQKTIFKTNYFYNTLGALEKIEKNKDPLPSSDNFPPDGICTSTYTYKNNMLEHIDSICDDGGGCIGLRKLIAYNDKKQVSSITLISGIVNNQCEPTNYISPSQFNEFTYDEKKFIKQEKIKNSNVYKEDSSPLTYTYAYTGNRLDSIELNPLDNNRVNETIQKVVYNYNTKQLLISIDIYYAGDGNPEKFKYEFVY